MIRIIVPCSSDERVQDLYKSLQYDGIEKFSRDVKITFCLNNPTEKIMELVKRLDKTFCESLVSEKNGISVAKNLAIKSKIGKTNFFNFLDSDCLVKKGYLENLVKVTRENTPPLIFRGEVEFTHTNGELSQLNCYLRTISYKKNPGSFLSPNITVSREVFKKVGLFNEKMKFGEDLEFGQRISEFGLRVEKRGSIKIIHKDDESFLKTIKTIWGYGHDRGYRICRRIKLKKLTFKQFFSQILGFQTYWENFDLLKILYAFFYTLISRTSTLHALLFFIRKEKQYFLQVEMTTGGKRIIQSLPFGSDLP